MSAPGTTRRKWIRRGLWSAVAATGMLAILVALLPAILSGEVGRGLIRHALADHIRGSVEVGELSLTWSGPQVVKDLALVGSDASQVKLDIRVDNGLVALWRLSEPPRLAIAGSVSTKYLASGELTLGGLLVDGQRKEGSAKTAGPSAGKSPVRPLFDSIRGALLKIDRLSLRADSAEGGPPIEVAGMTGVIEVTDAGIRAELSAETRVGESAGSAKFKGDIGNLIGADGALSIAGASTRVELTATNMPLPAAGVPILVESISLEAHAEKIASAVALAGQFAMRLPSGERADASVQLDARSPLDATTRSIDGSIRVASLPTSALAPYLPGSVDPMRELGPTLDIDATLSGRSASLRIASEHCQASASGSLSEAGDLFAVESFTASARLAPEWLGQSLTAPGRIATQVSASGLTLPVPAQSQPLAWSRAAGSITISVDPTELRASAGAPAQSGPTLEVGTTTIELSSAGLSTGASFTLKTTVGGASVSVDQQVTNLVGQGGLSVKAARSSGSIHVASADLRPLDLLGGGAREAIEAICDGGLGGFDARLENEGAVDGGSLRAQMTLGGRTAAMSGGWTSGGYTVEAISAKLAITQAIIDRYLGVAVTLAAPCEVALSSGRFAGTWQDLHEGRAVPASVSVAVNAPEIQLANAPGVRSAAVLRNLKIDATLASAGGGLTAVDGNVKCDVHSAQSKAASIACTLRLTEPASPRIESKFEVAVAQGGALAGLLDVGGVAPALAGPGTVAGTIVHTPVGDEITADVALPRLALSGSAKFAKSQDPQSPLTIDIGRTRGSFDVPAAAIEQFLGLRSGAGQAEVVDPEGERAFRWTVDLERCRLAGAAEDASVMMRLSIGPGSLKSDKRPEILFDTVSLSLSSPRLSQRAQASLTGRFKVGTASVSAVEANMDVEGDLRALLGAPGLPVKVDRAAINWKSPGAFALAAADWWRGDTSASKAIESLGALDARLTVGPTTLWMDDLRRAAGEAVVEIAATEFAAAGGDRVALSPIRMSASTKNLGESLSLAFSSATGKGGKLTLDASARHMVGGDGKLAPTGASWTAQLRAAKLPTAMIDALAGQGGSLSQALGSDLDATIDCEVGSAAGTEFTTVRAEVATQQLKLSVPRLRLEGGTALVHPDAPLELTFHVNEELKRKLLAPMNPVLADIRVAPPIHASITRLAAALDGNLAALNLDGRVEVGDVQVVRSDQVLGILALAQESKSETIPARIEPLVVTIKNGRLEYAGFTILAGKFGDQWQQKLILSGDIDLGRKPPYANAITCRYPLSSLARTVGAASGPLNGTLQEVSNALAALPIDPGALVQVDVTLSGPMQAADGSSAPLNSKVKLAFDSARLESQSVGETIRDVSKTIDGFRKLFGK